MVKYYIEYEVNDQGKYLSHLEMMKIFRQGFMRTGLRIQYSEGFNPHMRLSFATAKSVGLNSKCEILDIYFKEPYDHQEIIDKLNKCTPNFITILDIVQGNEKKFNINKALDGSKYHVKIKYMSNEDQEQLKSLQEIDAVVKSKRGFVHKNILEHIRDISFENDENGDLNIYIDGHCGSTLNFKMIEYVKHIYKNHPEVYITCTRTELLCGDMSLFKHLKEFLNE